MIAGSATLALSHLVPVAIAADHDFANQGGWFAAPVIGPWVYLGARKGCSNDSDQFTGSVCAFGNTMLVMVVVVDGLMQAAGAAMLVGGLIRRPRPEAIAAKRMILPTVVTTSGGGWVPGVAGSF